MIVCGTGAKRSSRAQRRDLMPIIQVALVIRRSRSSTLLPATNQWSSTVSPASPLDVLLPPISERSSARVASSKVSACGKSHAAGDAGVRFRVAVPHPHPDPATRCPRCGGGCRRGPGPGCRPCVLRGFPRRAEFLAFADARPSRVRSSSACCNMATPSPTRLSRCARRFSAAFSSTGLAAFSSDLAAAFSSRAARESSHSVTHGGRSFRVSAAGCTGGEKHQADGVFAGKLATRAGTLAGEIGERHPRLIGILARAHRQPPQHLRHRRRYSPISARCRDRGPP